MIEKANRWSMELRNATTTFIEDAMKNADDVLVSNVNEIRKVRQSLRDAVRSSKM